MPRDGYGPQNRKTNSSVTPYTDSGMYLVYSAVLTFGLLIALPYYASRFRKYLPDIGQRFGFVPRTDGRRPIWIHAVSVGEFRAVEPLIKMLHAETRQPILVSTTTPTGRAVAISCSDVDRIIYFPLDLSGIVRRALGRLRPEVVIIAETEIWPNFLRECRRVGTPVVMVNGRVSDHSLRRYRIVRRWLGRVLADYALLGMQSDDDARRIRGLGAPQNRIQVFGNLKYDGTRPNARLDDVLARYLETSRPVVVAASTARGEETFLIDAFRRLTETRDRMTLLIAPRRSENFDEVCLALDRAGIQWYRRSRLPAVPAACSVVVLDSIGELTAVFEFASVVFMGGTLVPRGGHNILEPARYGKPVLFGPYMNNFRDIAREFLDRGAALEVHTSAELAQRIGELLDDPGMAARLAEAAQALLGKNAGATARAVNAILALEGVSL